MDRRFRRDDGQRKVGWLAYALAAFSIIPIIGVVLGAMSITWGVNTRKARGNRLAAFAALGVAISVVATVVLYRESGGTGLMRWLERHDTFDLIRTGVARSALDRLVPVIEFYKARYGHYPDTLEEVAESLPKETDIFITDPMTVRAGRMPANFFYRRIDPDHYYLRSVGPDGIPFTADDILPNIEVLPGSALGLIKEPPTQI